VDQALAMARRLGDDELLLDACQVGFTSLWKASTAEERLGLADESLALAGAIGKERAYVVSACLRAVALGELGRPAEMWHAAELARTECERLRIPYGLLVLESMLLPWLAMAGRFEECDAAMERIRSLSAQISLEQSQDAVAGAYVTLALWRRETGQAATMLESMEGGPFPISATVVTFLSRGGEEQRARDYYAGHPVRLDTDDWFSLLNWGMAAEAALFMGDAALGEQAYPLLLPFAGRSGGAGSGNASGPVDTFLAEAAAAQGDLALATRHANDAAALCERWEIPLAAQWLRGQRERYGF
jgi:hypothetical protein